MRERNRGYFEATWGPDFHVDEAATLMPVVVTSGAAMVCFRP